MKKTLICLLVIVLLALIVVSVVLCIEFFGLYGSSKEMQPQSSEVASLSEMERFVQEKWGVEKAELLSPERLVLYQSYEITYEQACRVGGNIFVDDLAPETYVPLTLTIAADVGTRFACPSVTVELCYLSTDGKMIFRVDSDGMTETCWDE